MIDAFTQGAKVGLNGLGLIAPFALVFMAYHGYFLLRSWLDRSKRISALLKRSSMAEADYEYAKAELAAINRVLDDHGAQSVEAGNQMVTARRVRVALEAKR
jgi:hypothetical protein